MADCDTCGEPIAEGEARIEDPGVAEKGETREQRGQARERAGVHHPGCYARRQDTPSGEDDPLLDSDAVSLEALNAED